MYITPAHHDILAMVRAWRIGDRPLLVMTGDSGTGKTTFARKLAATFGATMQVGLLDAEKAQAADLRQQVPAAFGSAVRFLPHDPLTSHDQFMAECLTTGRRRLLIVDEAQHLTEAALDYLKRVTTPPRSGLPVFYVVLIGGPELQALLARPELQALHDRIGSQLQLSPFTEAQTAAYVDHRLRVSDCQCAVSDLAFDAGRLGLLHEASGGRPKMINRLVQRVLFDPVRAGAAVKVARTAPPVEDKPTPAPPTAAQKDPTPLPAPVAPVAEETPAGAQLDAAGDEPVAVPAVARDKPVAAQPKKAADPATAKHEPAVQHPAVAKHMPAVAPPVVVQPVAAQPAAAKDTPASVDRARTKAKPQPAPSAVIKARPAPLQPAKVDEAKAPFQRPATWGKAVPLQAAAVRDRSAPRPSLAKDKPTQPTPPRPEPRRTGPLKPATAPVTLAPRPAPAEASVPTAHPGPARTAPSVAVPRQKRGNATDGAMRRGLPWGLAATAGLALAAAGVLFLGQGNDQPAPVDIAAPSPAPVAAPPVAPAPAASPEPAPAIESVPDDPAPAPIAVEAPPEPEAPPPAPGLRGASVDPVPDADTLLTEALAAGATDPELAVQLYTRAALWGNARGAYYLGQLYETGIGVPPNPDRARAAYALALEVDGAAARLEALDGRATPGTSAAAAPVPLSQMVFTTGATELHWRDPDGAVASGFRVEFIPAGGEDIQQIETVLPALLLDQPLARWRVMALETDGSAGPASDWSLPDPALP